MNLDLGDALSDLHRATQRLRTEDEHRVERWVPSFPKLAAAVEKLGESEAPTSLTCPTEYVKCWQDVERGARETLPRRAIRFLCWEPSVACSEAFSSFLRRQSIDVGGRALLGLIRSCHVIWSPKFVDSSVLSDVRLRLESYTGNNRVLNSLRPDSGIILGKAGPKVFGKGIVALGYAIGTSADASGLDSHTPYFLEVAKAATERCREAMLVSSEKARYLIESLLDWKGWPVDLFREQIKYAILHSITERDDEYRNALIQFVLSGAPHPLGDPRHAHNSTKWISVGEEARQRFIQWLSREDITFFFDHVLPRGEDPHHRKPFWMRYVNRMVRSRPLLHPTDASRLQPELRRRRGGSYGTSRTSTSAFLLDFGDLIVVEFKASGAVFMYDRRVFATLVPDFWTSDPFTDSELRQRDRCVERVVHNARWQVEVSRILATHGIRPT